MHVKMQPKMTLGQFRFRMIANLAKHELLKG